MNVYPNPYLFFSEDVDGNERRLVASVPTEDVEMKVTDPRLLQIVGRASGGIEHTELIPWVAEQFDLSNEESLALYKNLEQKGLFVSGSCQETVEQGASSWLKFGWRSAFEYYCSTTESEYADLDTATDGWVDRVEENEQRDRTQPDVYKEYPEAESVSLDEPPDGSLGSFHDAISGLHETPSETHSQPLDEMALSTILYYTFGEMRKLSTPNTGDYLLKTSPSGGARHPTEAYVAVVNVDGIDRGVYHYSVAEHALEKLDADAAEFVASTCGMEEDVSIGIAFTTRVYRAMMKYPEPRAFQVVTQDIGHLVETLRLVCSSYQRQTRVSERCDARTLSELLSLDPFAEPIFGYLNIL